MYFVSVQLHILIYFVQHDYSLLCLILVLANIFALNSEIPGFVRSSSRYEERMFLLPANNTDLFLPPTAIFTKAQQKKKKTESPNNACI